jgi:hypothetical protein
LKTSTDMKLLRSSKEISEVFVGKIVYNTSALSGTRKAQIKEQNVFFVSLDLRTSLHYIYRYGDMPKTRCANLWCHSTCLDLESEFQGS